MNVVAVFPLRVSGLQRITELLPELFVEFFVIEALVLGVEL